MDKWTSTYRTSRLREPSLGDVAANAEIIPYLYSSLSARRIHKISEATKLRYFGYDWRFGRPFPFYNHWRRKILKEMNTAVLSSFSIPINQTRCFENLHHFDGREQGKTCKEHTKAVWLRTSLKLKIKRCGVMSRYQQIDCRQHAHQRWGFPCLLNIIPPNVGVAIAPDTRAEANLALPTAVQQGGHEFILDSAAA